MEYIQLLHIPSFDNQIHNLIDTIYENFESLLAQGKPKFNEYQTFVTHVLNIYSIIELHLKTKCSSVDLKSFDRVFQTMFTHDAFKRITYAFEESCDLHEFDIYFVKQVKRFLMTFHSKYVETQLIRDSDTIQIRDVIQFLLLAYDIQDELKYDSFHEYINKSIVIHNVSEIHSILDTFLKLYTEKLTDKVPTSYYQKLSEYTVDSAQMIIQVFKFYCSVLGLHVNKLSFNIFEVYDTETNTKKGTIYFDLFNKAYSDKCCAFNLWYHHKIDNMTVDPVVTIIANYSDEISLLQLFELIHQFANAFHTLLVRPSYYHINNDHYLEIVHIIANIFEHMFFSKMVLEQLLGLDYDEICPFVENYRNAQLLDMQRYTSMCLLYVFLYETPAFKEDLRSMIQHSDVDKRFVQNVSGVYNDILLYTKSKVGTKTMADDMSLISSVSSVLKSSIQNNFADYFIPVFTYIISNNIICYKLDNHVMNEFDDLQTIGIEFRKLFLQQNFHNKNIKDILFFLNEDHPFLQSFQE